MGSVSTLCGILVLILALILGIFNSDLYQVNEFLVIKLFSGFKDGVFCLQFKEDNNKILGFGDALIKQGKQGSVLSASNKNLCDNTILINNKKNVFSGFIKGTLGIGITYFNKDWTFDPKTGDIGDIITHLYWGVLNNDGAKYARYFVYFSKFEWDEYFYQKGLAKDKQGDMKDVSSHYFDYTFYEYMLDKSMTYTCGIWNKSTDSLYEAQINKVNLLIHKLSLNQDTKKVQNVLDVGSGWGFLASYLYNTSKTNGLNVNVTGITIAHDQHNYATRNFGDNNQGNAPYFYLLDFRDLVSIYGPNYFDSIVSVGVISHIHIKRLDEWFTKLYTVLKPGGYFVMQGIVGTSAFANGNKAWIDKEYACTSSNFLYRIFPGGCGLLSDWMHESAVKAGFITMHRDFIGQHYSKTLREWVANLEKYKKNILDEKITSEKVWLSYHIYLALAEAGYRTGKLDKAQFVFYKPRKDKIHTLPFEYGDQVQTGWIGFQ